MENLKYCSNNNCKEINPQPLSNFHKDKNTKDGYKCRCKSCLLAYAKEYNLNNRELRAKKQREYYKKHGDIQRQSSNNWKNNNKDKCKEYYKKWHEDNRKHRSEYYKQYYNSNYEYMLDRARNQRKNNRFSYEIKDNHEPSQENFDKSILEGAETRG